MTKLQQTLNNQFPDLPWQFNHPLAEHTYFKIGGPAEIFLILKKREAIIAVIQFCRNNDISVTFLGGGSNIVVADEGVPGLVLQLAHEQITIVPARDRDNTQDRKNIPDEQTQNDKDNDRQLVRAEAGAKTALVVRQTIDAGLTGLEIFLGVPGTIGGAIYNNAHYLQQLIGEHVSRVEIIDEKGVVRWLDHDQCEFAYDSSRFHHTSEILLQIEFSLRPGIKNDSETLMQKASQYRAKTQPLGLPSSGCIFKNVPNNDHLRSLFPQLQQQEFVGGGFLIDQAGLKGTRIGEIEVSDKHAAFFINRGQGTARQLKELVALVKNRVREKFGVELEEEIFYLPKK